MLVIPAIDIRGGRCVRLFQGDYGRETAFADHPADVAARWQQGGARLIHVVDLDGASRGEPVNTQAISDILGTVTVPIEVGGGVRSLAAIERLIELGVQRVILGTAAVLNPKLAADAAHRWGDRVLVGIDARDGMVAIHGWTETTSRTAVELARDLESLRVRRFIFTDISRDGTLESPNFDSTLELVTSVSVPVIASGGVSKVGDLVKLESIGVEGAIVGMALYSGAFTLADAIAALA